MTRFYILLLMVVIGSICAFFGAITWDTARVGTLSAFVALFVQKYFGEEA